MIPRIFIGCGPEHRLPSLVLKRSIEQHASVPVEVTFLLDVEKPHPIPERWKRKVPTSFSLQRFLIPAACGYEGVSMYLDSDMLVLGDVAEAFAVSFLEETPFTDEDRIHTAGDWQSAVMLIECSRVRWDIDAICDRLDRGKWRYASLSNLKYETGVTGKLGRNWNWHDRCKEYRAWERTHTPVPACVNLVHFTTLGIQPWVVSGKHTLESFWLAYLREAIRSGSISKDDVSSEISCGHVRPSLSRLLGEDPIKSDDEWMNEQRIIGRKDV